MLSDWMDYLRADQIAVRLADYVVTESGFAADLHLSFSNNP